MNPSSRSDPLVLEVGDRRARREFVRLPWRLHRGHTAWVPPLVRDERRLFDPRHPSRRYCDVTFALSEVEGRCCGRIVGIVNHRDNARNGLRRARFGWLECERERRTAEALLGHVERWARARGMTDLVGPLGFTDQDAEGFQIEGFDQEPTLATYCNEPYLPELMESCGYQKEVDYVVYRVEVPMELPRFYRRILGRVQRASAVRLARLTSRRQLAPLVEPVLRLMGETFDGLYGFVPPDEAERRLLAREFLPLLDPRFVKVALRDEAAVGFLIAMPNLAPGFRAANGRLWPFGAWHLLRAARRTRQLDLLVGGIHQRCRGQGVDVLLGAALLDSARKAGFTVLDSHHELEGNTSMHREMERLGGTVYKRYRVYGKRLG